MFWTSQGGAVQTAELETPLWVYVKGIAFEKLDNGFRYKRRLIFFQSSLVSVPV